MPTNFKKWNYRIWKGGSIVKANFSNSKTFKKSEVYPPLDKSRIFAVDTESFKINDERGLATLLVPVHFDTSNALIETPDGTGMLERLFELLFEQPGFAQPAGAPNRTKQRRGGGHKRKEKRAKITNGRDGRRMTVSPVLSVWFNLPYDFGRLVADSKERLRAVSAGADSYDIRISDRFKLSVSKMIFGSASSFEWFVYDIPAKLVMRLLGVDLTGYWKSSLANCAKAMGISEKIDIESQIGNAYERLRNQFTYEDWEKVKEYAIGDTKTTLELYHRTVDSLMNIDPRVIRRNGVIPPSAPGASAKTTFAKAFDCHPDLKEWSRYPSIVDQAGCDGYFGGRVFCSKPGIHKGIVTLDLKSAYPFQTALMPDPVTVKMEQIDPQPFHIDNWRGKYGVLYVSGESLDNLMPAFRTHDPKHNGRLRYVTGPFVNVAVTIPELVIGSLRGVLRIDQILGGWWMNGSAENSFLRAATKDFFAIKEDGTKDKPVRDMAKLMLCSLYGKLIEVQQSNYLIHETSILMPNFFNRKEVAKSLVELYANHEEPKDVYWGPPDKIVTCQQLFQEAMTRFQYVPRAEKPEYAVRSYIRALDLGGIARKKGCKSVQQYTASFKRYRCGTFFMAIYAAQITGATSAMVGAMAQFTNALQGDTDSVHIQLPEGVTRVEQLPGYHQYLELMRQAGYPSPHKVNGQWVDGVDCIPGLGSWEQETPVKGVECGVSVESVLVRPKLYSHKFQMPDGSFEYKQAKHGMAKFSTAALEGVRHDYTQTRDQREKKMFLLRAEEQHEAMKQIAKGFDVTYMTRPSPRRHKQAVRTNLAVGEFIQKEVTIGPCEDPNNYIDPTGTVRWKPYTKKLNGKFRLPPPALKCAWCEKRLAIEEKFFSPTKGLPVHEACEHFATETKPILLPPENNQRQRLAEFKAEMGWI